MFPRRGEPEEAGHEHHWRMMIVKIHTSGLRGLDEIRAFLAGSQPLDFEAPTRSDAYGWIATELRRLAFSRQDRRGRGLIRAYLLKVSGLSRAQLTRLITSSRRPVVLPIVGGRRRGPSCGNTRRRTFVCSPKSMRCTARSRVQRRANSANVH